MYWFIQWIYRKKNNDNIVYKGIYDNNGPNKDWFQFIFKVSKNKLDKLTDYYEINIKQIILKKILIKKKTQKKIYIFYFKI